MATDLPRGSLTTTAAQGSNVFVNTPPAYRPPTTATATTPAATPQNQARS